MSARTRAVASGLVHRGWEWITKVGLIGPDHERGRRFHAMGRGSSIAFPPGNVFGQAGISIGADTMIGSYVSLAVGMGEVIDRSVPPIITIGDRCSIGRGSSIVGRIGIEIGDDVTFAPNVYVTDHNHTYDDVDVPIVRQWPADDPVSIGSGCWLATGVVVLPGTHIGDHVAVASNSVVRGTIPDRCVIAGVPAKVVRQYIDGQGWDPPLGPRVIRSPQGWVAT
jgi:acetyltransferase-like isoleucine patch superfamily enzyme